MGGEGQLLCVVHILGPFYTHTIAHNILYESLFVGERFVSIRTC